MEELIKNTIHELREMCFGIKAIKTIRAEKYWISEIRNNNLLEHTIDILARYRIDYKLAKEWKKKSKLNKIILVIRGLDGKFFIE